MTVQVLLDKFDGLHRCRDCLPPATAATGGHVHHHRFFGLPEIPIYVKFLWWMCPSSQNIARIGRMMGQCGPALAPNSLITSVCCYIIYSSGHYVVDVQTGTGKLWICCANLCLVVFRFLWYIFWYVPCTLHNLMVVVVRYCSENGSQEALRAQWRRVFGWRRRWLLCTEMRADFTS